MTGGIQLELSSYWVKTLMAAARVNIPGTALYIAYGYTHASSLRKRSPPTTRRIERVSPSPRPILRGCQTVGSPKDRTRLLFLSPDGPPAYFSA